jgi:hypothetical protein
MMHGLPSSVHDQHAWIATDRRNLREGDLDSEVYFQGLPAAISKALDAAQDRSG